MQAVLMVAGSSTRTYPLTLTRPKPLLPILNKPLIKHSLDQLVGLFNQVIFITGYRKEMIEELMGNSYRGMELIYVEQKEQLGTGHAVLQAKSFISKKFVAMNGDDLFAHVDLAKIIQYNYAALAKRVPDPSIYGVFQCDEQNRIQRLVEKPKEYIGDLANIGCYVLQPEFFDELERTPLSERGEIEITSTIQTVAEQTDFHTVPIEGFWLPTGYAWDLLKHQEFLMQDLSGEQQIDGTVEAGAVLKDFVSVGKNTVIKSGAYIEGPVIIGDNCQIGPNCYIRGNTAIGNNCRVGNAVEIKNSVIMDNTNIAHLSFVGDSVIGYDCNLGAGTITANLRHDEQEIASVIKGKLVNTGRKKLGAVLADGVHTGIHTSILPGRKLWPDSSTHPAQVVEKDIQFEK